MLCTMGKYKLARGRASASRCMTMVTYSSVSTSMGSCVAILYIIAMLMLMARECATMAACTATSSMGSAMPTTGPRDNSTCESSGWGLAQTNHQKGHICMEIKNKDSLMERVYYWVKRISMKPILTSSIVQSNT